MFFIKFPSLLAIRIFIFIPFFIMGGWSKRMHGSCLPCHQIEEHKWTSTQLLEDGWFPSRQFWPHQDGTWIENNTSLHFLFFLFLGTLVFPIIREWKTNKECGSTVYINMIQEWMKANGRFKSNKIKNNKKFYNSTNIFWCS